MNVVTKQMWLIATVIAHNIIIKQEHYVNWQELQALNIAEDKCSFRNEI